MKIDTIEKDPAGWRRDAAIVALSALLAYGALLITATWRVDLENLAKGEQNTSRVERADGVPYTASSVKEIRAIIEHRAANGAGRGSILWLGNSQLHYINQYREGDHLSPYWLRRSLGTVRGLEPLGCSLANANLQEYLVLSRYVAGKIPVRMVVAALVFDDLREDGLRDDFSEILGPGLAAQTQDSPTAAEIVRRFAASSESGGGDDALAGTIQRPVERRLNEWLLRSWKLWSERSLIEGRFQLALYTIRNSVFGITPSTTRRMIPARYERNMEALRDILDHFKRQGVPVVLYIAPIRQDKPIPYEENAYGRWKSEVRQLADAGGSLLVDLEELVPADEWGSYTGDDVDFMHFQGAGHRRVAEALLPVVREMAAEGRP